MDKKEQRLITIWANNIESGVLHYYIKITLITCFFSAIVVLLYTWNNIQEGRLTQSLLPLTGLVFGLGIPIGLVISWSSWNKGNNKYKFLTKHNNPHTIKKKWYGQDRVWDLAVPNVGAIYFILLYASIFLFDSGQPNLLTYAIVGVLLSYFIALIAYRVYRYKADKLGNTKHFPLSFKYTFSIIIFLTVILIAYWAIVNS